MEVSLAIVSTRPIRQHLLSGSLGAQLLSPMRAREAGGGWEKDGIAVSALGRTPHHKFRHNLCPSAKSRTSLALFESPVDTAAGLAAPWLLLTAVPHICRFDGSPGKGMFFSVLPQQGAASSSHIE